MTLPEYRGGFFRLSDSLTALPVIHESGDYAMQVRKEILSGQYDCLAVALPPSFQAPVIQGIGRLPEISAVIQREGENPDAMEAMNYVPIDPCQGMIMGIRVALEEHIPCTFVDMEVDSYEVYEGIFPDPYALKRIPIVMMTSSREEQDLARCYDLGANAYVVKPVRFAEFLEAV